MPARRSNVRRTAASGGARRPLHTIVAGFCGRALSAALAGLGIPRA
ncbi:MULTISPECIES: hypothetical protein [Streptomyces]|uniref:Uncharacterized protein n=1 Tax=Streptomyces sp. R33 TaxID=3238629 RepID=A0AB39Y2W5_9ACTN|nr:MULTISPECIES: hypothetical protein [Streptomyces]TDU76385.1 hypothetical protein EDD91_3092 [Streptomyces sp. KS 21]